MYALAHRKLAKRFNKGPMKAPMNDITMEILKLLFNEEEAGIVAGFGLSPARAGKIAKQMKRPVDEIRPILDGLSDRGLILALGDGEERTYSVLPIVPGIFEFQMGRAPVDEKSRRFAELFEQYFTPENLEESMVRSLKGGRVIPVEESVIDTSGVMPREQFREAISEHDVFALAHACSCRQHKELVGNPCTRPKDVCMQFGPIAEFSAKNGFGRLVSREEMMDAIDRAEEAGLVHITDNVTKPSFSCNCCGCCCGILTHLNGFNLPSIFARSRFMVKIDEEACNACGKCARVCPVGAVHVLNKKLIYESWRCIGCGVCIGSCNEHQALALTLRPDWRPIADNHGQLAVDLATQYFGIDKYTNALPGFTRFFGNRLQKSMSRD